eukprot:3239436-Pleurochrysis_carterae.AAC.1
MPSASACHRHHAQALETIRLSHTVGKLVARQTYSSSKSRSAGTLRNTKKVLAAPERGIRACVS